MTAVTEIGECRLVRMRDMIMRRVNHMCDHGAEMTGKVTIADLTRYY